jgi:putative endonuclease
MERALRSAEIGRRAEDAAARYIEGLGWTVLGRNVRVSRLEIDLIARDGEVVVVLEVRTRGSGAWERALDSVGHGKRLRIRRAGESLWRTRFRRDLSLQRMRFDLVSVDLDAASGLSIEHVRAAF